MNSPEKYWFDQLGYGDKDGKLEMRKCKECEMYTCEHIRKEQFKGHTTIVEPKNTSSSTVSTKETTKDIDANNASTTASNTHTSQRFVKCNICESEILYTFLSKHLRQHIDNAQVVKTTDEEPKKETALIGPIPMKRAETIENKEPAKPKIANPELRAKERYRFRNIENVSAVASTSSNGRYSDFTITFWLQDKWSALTSYYAGGSSSSSYKEHERLVVNVVYDSLEDYYALGMKILKRGGHSSWDQEELVPDHICEQHELWDTIRKAMVWMSVSPKGATKYFLKLLQQEWKTNYAPNGKASVSETVNVALLNEKLSKQGNFCWSGVG